MIEWPTVHPVRVYPHRKHRVYLLLLVPATPAAVEAAGFGVCQLTFGAHRAVSGWQQIVGRLGPRAAKSERSFEELNDAWLDVTDRAIRQAARRGR